jgi:carbamoyl-phosphate synthase small subunit
MNHERYLADKACLVLEDGTVFGGQSFGFPGSVAGEVVFNTGMVGYPEALTDPSYRGQILVLTYPLIGNYGVPARGPSDALERSFESGQVQVSGLIVSDQSGEHNHWDSSQCLAAWLSEQRVPAMSGVDTRSLTKRLREKGTLLGKLLVNGQETAFRDSNSENLVSQVSLPEPVVYSGGKRRVVVVDCGCKNSIIHNLLARNVTVIRVPWNYDFLNETFDGLLISNGPGNPEMCRETVDHVRRAMERSIPVLGICLGHQILALAAGAHTYKLKYGHRSQNQPCTEVGTNRCYITSQNHGYAVDVETLSGDWEPWFTNANDGTNEGIRHRSRPFLSVQFHPEAAPGPTDTNGYFDKFLELI